MDIDIVMVYEIIEIYNIILYKFLYLFRMYCYFV